MGTERPDLRYEVKSVIPSTELPRVKFWLRLHPAAFRVAYPPRSVNSLYFDSPDRLGFQENLSGIAERRKLRLRWYGETLDRVTPTLELKCKQGLLGWKESHRFEEEIALEGVRWPALRATLRERLPERFRSLLDLAGEPVLLVRYERAYLVSADGLIRATVDADVTAVDQTRHASLRAGPPEPVPDDVVLEVKCSEDDRGRLEQVLGEWPLRVGRNSKFARGMASLPNL